MIRGAECSETEWCRESLDRRTVVTGASHSIDLMTRQPLHLMGSGAAPPLQCFPAGAPTARRCADCGALFLLQNALQPFNRSLMLCTPR